MFYRNRFEGPGVAIVSVDTSEAEFKLLDANGVMLITQGLAIDGDFDVTLNLGETNLALPTDGRDCGLFWQIQQQGNDQTRFAVRVVGMSAAGQGIILGTFRNGITVTAIQPHWGLRNRQNCAITRSLR